MNTDIEAAKKAYGEFKLRWLLKHGFTADDLFFQFSQYITECCEEAKWLNIEIEEVLNESNFEQYLEDVGFNGFLWPCFDEFYENEWKELYERRWPPQ